VKGLFLLSIFVFSAITVLLVACGGSDATSNNPNTIRTEGGTFATTSISIKKGSTITFLDDSNNGALHYLIIGQSGQEAAQNGAPDFGGLSGHRIEGGDVWTTAPWNTAGTYHVTCTVHPNMNLTVTVMSA
jgi:plastocyanin